ncbi:DUF4351 domain-containing protein [Leptothermofonsia sp. ETS-13]
MLLLFFPRLKAVGEALLDFFSLADLEEWLLAHP